MWNPKFKKEILDKQIDEEISNAEKEIEILRKNAPEKINKIAIETSSDLLKTLIGAEVNNSSISAIVDDLSKKNTGKYYDNWFYFLGSSFIFDIFWRTNLFKSTPKNKWNT